MRYNTFIMIAFSIILFLIVLLVSGCIYLFCKRVIYKLNKRVLPRNLAVLKNRPPLANFNNLTEPEIREKLILPFFQILGYNTNDMREFARTVKRENFLPDYITKKWDNSRLCKRTLSIKYIPFSEDAVDTNNQTFCDNNYNGSELDELMNKLYFKSEYFVLTNGYLYVFFNKSRVNGSRKYDFLFNLKKYSKDDVAKLAYFTKQYMFLEISDVYRS